MRQPLPRFTDGCRHPQELGVCLVIRRLPVRAPARTVSVVVSLGKTLHPLPTGGGQRARRRQSGQIAFREFLKSEYSEENILFWLDCEEYKKIKTVPEMISSANRIYSEFVQTEAPRQINIDCTTRESITNNISKPTLTSFDTAQKHIYSLLARDCYPRFLKSDIYQGLLRRNDSR
uniref:Regulator of G-protein signaling 1 n=1 Tax=Pundamilia nyererei TaxID=303518 RepID=A0A3B4GU40_9CICH